TANVWYSERFVRAVSLISAHLPRCFSRSRRRRSAWSISGQNSFDRPLPRPCTTVSALRAIAALVCVPLPEVAPAGALVEVLNWPLVGWLLLPLAATMPATTPATASIATITTTSSLRRRRGGPAAGLLTRCGGL